MPDSFEELYDRAQRALAAGWPEQALVPATEAAKLAPQHAGARLLLARAWLGNAGYPRAIADARAVLELNPSGTEAAAAHEVIGRASVRTKATADAEAALRETRRLAATPVGSALLCVILCESGKAAEAGTIAHDEARRPDDERWDPVRGSFEALATVVASGDPARIPLVLADLCFDAGLLDEAKARYQAVLAKDPDSERAADGLRALAAGEPRPKAAVRAMAPDAAYRRARLIRLAISASCGGAILAVLARWEMLEPYGPLRQMVVVAAVLTVLVLVVLARRDEVAHARKAEIAAAAGTAPPATTEPPR